MWNSFCHVIQIMTLIMLNWQRNTVFSIQLWSCIATDKICFQDEDLLHSMWIMKSSTILHHGLTIVLRKKVCSIVSSSWSPYFTYLGKVAKRLLADPEDHQPSEGYLIIKLLHFSLDRSKWPSSFVILCTSINISWILLPLLELVSDIMSYLTTDGYPINLVYEQYHVHIFTTLEKLVTNWGLKGETKKRQDSQFPRNRWSWADPQLQRIN